MPDHGDKICDTNISHIRGDDHSYRTDLTMNLTGISQLNRIMRSIAKNTESGVLRGVILKQKGVEGNMKRVGFGLVIACLFSVLSCDFAWAQATAQIGGTVRDQSGAVLPGVEITATQTETGLVRKTITNETGSYVLSNLALGPYRLEAGLPGFRTFVQ